MTRTVCAILERYGLHATVHGEGEERAVRCFIQPLMNKNRVYLHHAVTELGRVDEGRYLYIGPSDTAVEEGCHIVCHARRFDVLRGEPVWLGNALSHWCAVLRPRPEEAES